jgi:uncharacterized coiled-coil DUF342 family protein
METLRRTRYLRRMDDETRAAFAALTETMSAGFARTDHFFELQQAQHLELSGKLTELRGEVRELRDEVRELRDRVESLTDRVSRLEHEVGQLRDFVAREISDIRIELRTLRERADATDDLRRDIAELTVRVDRIERRQQD